MSTRGAEVFWRPRDPGAGGDKVRMLDSELTAYISDKKPMIIVERESVEDPACFWIDHEHVYLRINWEKWAPVSRSNPELAASLCRSRYCRVTAVVDKVVADCIVPVFHIAALPEELFGPPRTESAPENRGGEGSDSNSGSDSDSDDEDMYQGCLMTVLEAVGSLSRDAGVYEHVKFGGDSPTFVIKYGDRTLILDALPPDLEFFIFLPAGTGEDHGPLEREWEKGLISLGFIERLKRMEKFAARMEPDSVVRAGFLANPDALDMLRALTRAEDIAGIELLSYNSLKDRLADLLALKED
ncbi:MAG: hypothetical protein IJT50_03135 [Lentisphaeria bacterium]|nr:hypothetical protein [Lentisphaeria bacterium]